MIEEASTGAIPRVSVIMPAYNQAQYIEEAIESLQRQTFCDWEVLVVDDGSPDNVMEIAGRLAADDCRIRLLHTGNNGVSAARNHAVGFARGEYLLALDADDTIEPEYIGRCVEVMDGDSGIDVAYCQWKYFGTDAKTQDVCYFDYESLLLANCIFVTAMIRKDRFLQVGGFDESMRKGLEDWEFWIRYLNENSRVYQFRERWFNYRIKPVSRNAEAHRGIGPFELQMYILEKHKETYDRYFGAPITAMSSFKDARKYKRKYDKVFYRRFWHSIKSLCSSRKSGMQPGGKKKWE